MSEKLWKWPLKRLSFGRKSLSSSDNGDRQASRIGKTIDTSPVERVGSADAHPSQSERTPTTPEEATTGSLTIHSRLDPNVTSRAVGADSFTVLREDDTASKAKGEVQSFVQKTSLSENNAAIERGSGSGDPGNSLTLSSEMASCVPYALKWTEHELALKPVKTLPGSNSPGTTKNPFPLDGHTCSPIPNSDHEFIIFGGRSGAPIPDSDQEHNMFGDYSPYTTRVINDIFLLSTEDMSLTQLETTGSVPPAREVHQAAIVGRILVVLGGNNDDSFLYLLDLETRVWSKLRPPYPFPEGRLAHSIIATDDALWLFGGRTIGTSGDFVSAYCFDDLWCLNLGASNSTERISWREVPKREPWPTARAYHSAIRYRNKFYIFGGAACEDGEQPISFGDVWEFNTHTEAWTNVQCRGSIPPARSGHSSTLIGDNMFVFGGAAKRSQRSNNLPIISDDAFVFSIESGIWTSLGMLGETPPPANRGTLSTAGSRLAAVGGYQDKRPCIYLADTQQDDWFESRAKLHFTIETTGLKFTTDTLDLTRFVRKQGDAAHSLAGFSDVWRGEMTETREPIAIKVLRIASTSNPDDPQSGRLRTRFNRELKIWMECQDPRILELRGYAYIEGIPCLISPWCSNGNIMEYVVKNPNASRRELITQVAEGLVYLHGRDPSVIHSDIKPANVLVSNEGSAKICDFGISKLMSENPSGFTTTASVKGTLRYSSPEMLDLDGHSTTESDIWAYAMLVLHVMTNKIPYAKITSDPKVIMAIMDGSLPSPEDYSELPVTDPLWDIMKECWNKDPTKRPTMVDVLERLRACTTDQTV